MNYKLVSNFHIIKYIIFCIQIYKILCSISFKFPYSLYLPNGNIFVIHEKGISIYDHLLTKQISEVLIFPENDTIKSKDISRITSILEDEYLFCIIKDKIYIFNDKGNLLFYNNTSILENEVIPKYYSLVVIKNVDNLYKYVIGYIFNNYLYMSFFEYNITSG